MLVQAQGEGIAGFGCAWLCSSGGQANLSQGSIV